MAASGTGLGCQRGDESYGYDGRGYLKAQSAKAAGINGLTSMRRRPPAEVGRKYAVI